MRSLLSALRWAVTPPTDPIDRACSIIALFAVLFLTATVIGVELAR